MSDQDRTPEYVGDNSLQRLISEARRDMGEARWQELCAEWDAPVPHVRSNGVRQWREGGR